MASFGSTQHSLNKSGAPSATPGEAQPTSISTESGLPRYNVHRFYAEYAPYILATIHAADCQMHSNVKALEEQYGGIRDEVLVWSMISAAGAKITEKLVHDRRDVDRISLMASNFYGKRSEKVLSDPEAPGDKALYDMFGEAVDELLGEIAAGLVIAAATAQKPGLGLH